MTAAALRLQFPILSQWCSSGVDVTVDAVTLFVVLVLLTSDD